MGAKIMSDLALRLSTNTAEFKKGLTKAKGSVSSFKKSATSGNKQVSASFKNMTKSASSSLGGMTSMLGPIGMSFGPIIGGIQGMTVATKGLGAALVATGIGAIFIAIGLAIAALSAYFKGTVEGAGKLAGIMGYLGGIMTALKDIIINVGKELVWAFENPKEAIKSLWESIKQNLVNRFEGAIQFFQSGFELLKNGFLGVANALKGIFDDDAKQKSDEYFAKALVNAGELGEAMLKMSTGFTVDDIKAVGDEIAKQSKHALDTGNKSKALALDAHKLELDKISLIAKEAKERTNIAKLVRVSSDKEGATNNERLQAIKDAIKVESDLGDTKIKIAQEALRIQEEQMALGENGIEDIRELATLEAAVTGELKVQSDKLRELENRREEINNSIRNYGAESVEAEGRIQKAQEATAKAKEKADKAALDRDKQNAQKFAQDIILRDQAILESDPWGVKVEKTKAHFQTIQDELKKMHANNLISDQEYADASAQITGESTKAVTDIKTGEFQKYLGAASEALDSLSSIYSANKEKELRAAGDNAKKREAIERKYAKKEQKIAIGKALINAASAAARAFADYAFPYSAIIAGLAGGAALAQVSAISSQNFANGGVVSGTSFTGDKVPVNVNSGEMILNKSQQANLFKLANQGVMGGQQQVTFRIDGTQLVGVLANQTTKTNSF